MATRYSYEVKLKAVELIRSRRDITAKELQKELNLKSQPNACIWHAVINERMARGMSDAEIMSTGFYVAKYRRDRHETPSPKSKYKQVPLFTPSPSVTMPIPPSPPPQVTKPQPLPQPTSKKKNIVLVCSEDPQAILDVLKGML